MLVSEFVSESELASRMGLQKEDSQNQAVLAPANRHRTALRTLSGEPCGTNWLLLGESYCDPGTNMFREWERNN